jgi:hypothetical protein
MHVKSLTIGGWFQRTTLHLTEIYSFLSGKDIKELDKKILQKNLKNLGVLDFRRVVDEIEYLEVKLKDNLKLKVTEDGLITLTKKITKNDLKSLQGEVEKIKDFYENNLSSAISYIFSRGAPVPKELAKIEAIFPFIFEIENKERGDMLEIFRVFKDEITSETKSGEVGIYKGKKVMVIENLSDESMGSVFVETEIFFREFKTQMARYLHIHREIWEKVNDIKERENIRGKDIIKIREELQEEQKSINLIEARINQMPIYLKTRQKLTDISIHKELHPLFQYKFETLLDTHDYIKSLWSMTKNYLNSALDMLGVLQAESTKSSISSLTLITTIGVVAGLVNYTVRDTFPKPTMTGFYYFLGLLLATFLINLGVVWFYKYKKYKIKK